MDPSDERDRDARRYQTTAADDAVDIDDVPAPTPAPAPAPTPLRPAPTRRIGSSASRGKAALAALALIALVGGAIALRSRARAPGPTAATPVAVARGKRPLFAVVFDRSPNPKVARAYAAAMQAARDASLNEARANLDRALAIDPSFAPAHLAYVLLARAVGESVREHYRRASEHRATLDERERALLEALEPLVRADPDLNGAVARLRAVLAAAPGDDVTRYALARAQWFVGDLRGEVDTLASLRVGDEPLALAHHDAAIAEEFLGEKDRAVAEYRACIDAAPAAARCLTNLAALEAREGACSDAVADIRRAIHVAPDDAEAQEDLANVLATTGAPKEALMAVVDRTVALQPEPDRPLLATMWRAKLAALRGDFEDLPRAIAEWRGRLPPDADVLEHFTPVEYGYYVALETGRVAEARAVAEQFLRESPAWAPSTFVADPSLEAAAMLYRVGALSKEDLANRRTKWLAGLQSPKLAPWMQAGLVWWLGYAQGARDPADAREAITARASMPPLTAAPARDPSFDTVVGEVYVAAGDPKSALPSLRRATLSCAAADEPFHFVRAFVTLGRASESLGDRDGACAAYAQVLARWGGARPLPISAESARRRLVALGCGPRQL